MTTKPRPETFNVTSRKVFSRDANAAPAPVYANNIEFAAMGVEVFMDVGTVDLESIHAAVQANANGESPESTVVDFNVQEPFAMTMQTAIQMHQKLTAMIQATKASMDEAMNNQTDPKG